jgi:hypothetical protein
MPVGFVGSAAMAEFLRASSLVEPVEEGGADMTASGWNEGAGWIGEVGVESVVERSR